MKKWLLVIFFLPVLLAVALYAFLQSAVFGARPDAAQLKRFSESAQFNAETGEFQNRRAHLFAEMRENASIPAMLREWFQDRPHSRPQELMPQSLPHWPVFAKDDANVRIIWLGHSTFLLRTNAITVLVDPVFSNAVAPVSFIGQRFQPPVLTLDQLPDIDVVLLSHDHYDHLDYNSILYLEKTNAVFVAPLGLGAHLQRWGVAPERIHERDWWQDYVFRELTFTATPAQHFSGRDGIKNNGTLWASWVIHSQEARLFFSGDSGFDTHFKTIGDRYGPFDIVFLEDGQYDQRWQIVHMMPEEAAQAAVDLQATWAMPVHWGMFELAYHTWYDPIVRFSAALEPTGIKLLAPMLGEVVALGDKPILNDWWTPLIPQ